MPTPNRVIRLSDRTDHLLEALYEAWPERHATYEDVMAEILRFYLAHQRGVTRDVRAWLKDHYPELAELDFSRPSRYDLPPEQR